MEKNYSDFTTWSSAHGHCNGTMEGGPVWFTSLPSGAAASVWADCDSGYTLAVFSGVPDSYTSLYGCDNVEIVHAVNFNSPLDFPVVSAGLLV